MNLTDLPTEVLSLVGGPAENPFPYGGAECSDMSGSHVPYRATNSIRIVHSPS